MDVYTWLPRYRKLPIPSSSAWWLIPLLLVVITFQVSEIESGKITYSLYRTSLLSIYYGVWLALAPLVYGLIILFDQRPKSAGSIFWLLIVSITLLATHLLVSNVLLSFTEEVFFGRRPRYFVQLQGIWPALVFNRLVTMVVIIFLLKVIDNFRQLQNTRLLLSNAENQLQQSQLERLQSQLNPHFLFNSLHTITSLIGFDDSKARELTVHLSDMLRTNLEKEQQAFQTFEEEINYVQSYMAIQQERFHDWVDITVSVTDQLLNKSIPSLLLQPLIENAFVHGIDGLTEKGNLSLVIKVKDEFAVIILENSVNSSYQSKPSTGLGLDNVRKRLDLIYEGKAALDLRKEATKFCVELKIPT